MRPAEGDDGRTGYELIPASYEYQYQECTSRSCGGESPGLGAPEQFGTLDAQTAASRLITGLVEGNAANAGVDLLPGDSIVKAGGTR